MDEEQIEEIWNTSMEHQFDCDWDELSEVGRAQVVRFANSLIEAAKRSLETPQG